MSSSEVTRHRLRPNVFGATRLYTLFFNKDQRIRTAELAVIAAGEKIFNVDSLDEIAAALTLEPMAGGLNIAPALALVAIGVLKPK
jgi:hypothetical protein